MVCSSGWPPGRRSWTTFLKAQNLVWLPEPLPPPKAPDEPPPPGLSEAGERAFRNYLLAGPHKVFAMSEHGYGFFRRANDGGHGQEQSSG